MNVGTAEGNLCREKSLEPRLLRRIILCVVQALSCSTAATLDSIRRISQYGHRKWRIQDAYFPGLPQDIAQTKDGYLWIGTDAGLVRFDGVRFVPWDSPNDEQLPSYQTTWVLALCAISVLAGFYLLYLALLRQVASQMLRRMEVQHAERERIARDLHDTLLRSVQGLILKFNAVAKQMPGEAPARQAIEKTLDFADQVLAEGRDRVRNLEFVLSRISCGVDRKPTPGSRTAESDSTTATRARLEYAHARSLESGAFRADRPRTRHSGVPGEVQECA